MIRIRDEFVTKLLQYVSLEGKDVLDVGCGDGVRSIEIARKCKWLTGIDPDEEAIRKANQLGYVGEKKIAQNAFSPKEKQRMSCGNRAFSMLSSLASHFTMYPRG